MDFNRWGSKNANTWAFTVFKKHYTEVIKMHNAYNLVPQYIYKDLGKVKNAKWEDNTSDYFGEKAKSQYEEELFDNLEEWSKYFKIFNKWSKYSSILALSGNFEIYIDKVVTISLQSDIGMLLNSSQSLDGMKLRKGNNTFNTELIRQYVLGCVKGTWYERVDQINKIFHWKPPLLCNEENLRLLDNIRKRRNDAAHAYGRNITKTKSSYGLEVTELTDISEKVITDYFNLVYRLAKEIDTHLLNNHIGEFQCLDFYHNLKISNEVKLKDKSKQQIGWASEILRKKYGTYSSTSMGKPYYKGLVEYYEFL